MICHFFTHRRTRLAGPMLALGLALACTAHPLGEADRGQVLHFERGAPFFVVGAGGAVRALHTYLCTNCTGARFEALEPPFGLTESPVWKLEARRAELRRLPGDASFFGFEDQAGNQFQHDARAAFPALLGGARFPCGPPFWAGFCGAIARLESDRSFYWEAGDTVHELLDGADRYILYASQDVTDLGTLPLPDDWTQRTRRLEAPLEVNSHGFLEAFSDVRGNLWQRREPPR